jgi:L-alanine-DL-glutamate epimerase-like enolase superfamily enzyme
MSDVRITDVEAIPLRLPVVSDRTDSSQDAVIVKVSTDAGVVGYGEVDASPSVVKAIVDAPLSHGRVTGLRELLVGQDPTRVSALWELMYESTLYIGRGGVVVQAMAGVDLALWDIAGKLSGVGVHRLLGGAHRDRMWTYASHMFDTSPERTAERAVRACENGFTAVKFGWPPFGLDAATDEHYVAAIRSAVGPEIAVCVDAGLMWDAKTAIARARRFAPYDLMWLEEPLHPDDLDGYTRLTSTVDIPIAAGEEECTLAGFVRLMDAGVDVVQIDVTRVGLTMAMRVAAEAHRRHLPVANHCFTTDLNVAASLQFLCSIPNALVLEYCGEESPLRTAVVAEPIAVEDGCARLPAGPGLGVEVTLDAVAEYRC